MRHLRRGRVVVLTGGTGNPYFTTDTGAVLRAAELDCDAVLKATNVDGVYSADPKLDPAATRYDRITHDEALARDLKVMDAAAFALAREAALPIIVFSIREPGAIATAAKGEGASRSSRPEVRSEGLPQGRDGGQKTPAGTAVTPAAKSRRTVVATGQARARRPPN